MRFVSLIALLTLASPLAAQDAPAAGQKTPDQTEQDKQVCRRIPVTGSNFGKRECHTKAEWAEIHERDAANAERALNNRAPNRPGSM